MWPTVKCTRTPSQNLGLHLWVSPDAPGCSLWLAVYCRGRYCKRDDLQGNDATVCLLPASARLVVPCHKRRKIHFLSVQTTIKWRNSDVTDHDLTITWILRLQCIGAEPNKSMLSSISVSDSYLSWSIVLCSAVISARAEREVLLVLVAWNKH